LRFSRQYERPRQRWLDYSIEIERGFRLQWSRAGRTCTVQVAICTLGVLACCANGDQYQLVTTGSSAFESRWERCIFSLNTST
jgi:hypothetical protein